MTVAGKTESAGSLNIESALIVALLILVASFTLFSLGDAIACLYAREASMANRIGFWAVAPEVTVSAGEAIPDGTVSWSTEAQEGPYTVLRARPGADGLDMEDHATWEDMGTFATPPATGIDVLPGDYVVIVAAVQKCGYKLVGPAWPEAPKGEAWYAGSFVAADAPGDEASATRWVAAFAPDGSVSWILPAEIQEEPAFPSRVGLADENLFVTYREMTDLGSGPELTDPAIYTYGGWQYPGTVTQPRLVVPAAVEDGAGDVWTLDLDLFSVSSDGLGILVPGTRYGDNARRMLIVSVETARATDTGLAVGDGDTGTFGRDGNAYATGSDGGIWRLSDAGNTRIYDAPAGMQLGSVSAEGTFAFYDSALGSGSLGTVPAGGYVPAPATAWANNASVSAATPDGFPVTLDGDGTSSADTLRYLSGTPVRERIVPREDGRGPSVMYLSFASVQGPVSGWDLTPDEPTEPEGDPTWPVVPSAGPGGTITPDATQVVADGGSASFTMEPAGGYHVEDVLVDGVSVGAVPSYEFTGVAAPHAIHVEFHDGVTPVPASYTVTPSAGPGGSISPAVPMTLPAGSDAAFAMAPAPGYRISSVSVDGGASVGTPPSYLFEGLSSDHAIHVEFEAVPEPEIFRYEVLVNGKVIWGQDFTPADPDSVYLNDTVDPAERDRYGRDVGSGEVALPMIRATSHRIAAVAGYGRSNYAEINAPGGLPAKVSSMAVPWSNLGEIANPGGGASYWAELQPDGESLSPGWAGSHVPLRGFWAQSIEHGMGHVTAIGQDGSPLAKSLCISLTRSGENRAAELGGYASRTYRMAGAATLEPAGEEDPDRMLNIVYPMLPYEASYRVPDSVGGVPMSDMSLQVSGVSWDGGAGSIPDSVLTYFGSDAGYPAVAAGSRGLLVMDTSGDGIYDHAAGDTLLSTATRLKRSTVQVRVSTPEGRTVKPRTAPSSAGWGTFDSGMTHSLAIHSDGTLWAWGDNTFGQLGLGDTAHRKVPVQVGTSAGWTAVSGGTQHSLAIRSDGTLWAWGYNTNGELGLGNYGSTTGKTSPVQVGTNTDWVSVSAGDQYSLATRSDGTLWAWGYNYYGQLGLADTSRKTAPVRVGTSTAWTSVSAGGGHSMAIRSDGTLWAWGSNTSGCLGLGDTTRRTSPVQVGTSVNWASVSSGGSYTLATRSDGTLWAWGRNSTGMLGLGDTTQRTTPVQVGTGNTWASVSAGPMHSLATRSDGTLWAWGTNNNGRLGLGDTTQRTSPVQVGTETSWSAVSAGGMQTLMGRSDGTLWGCGYNWYGTLGDGTSGNGTDKSVPVAVVGP